MNATDTLVARLNQQPETIEFDAVIAAINSSYQYTPTGFTCGSVNNPAGSNEGSCKILAFASLQNLTVQQTLSLFGRYYREDVLNHPSAGDHANIRSFMKCGWPGVSFESQPLTPLPETA